MQNSRETKILNCICVMLILFAGVVRRLSYYFGTFCYNNIICMLFAASAFIWIYQLQRRLVQPDVRKNLNVSALMMIFWMVLRTIKYEFLPDGSIAVRYAWYLYYIPQTFCVLLMFFSVLHIGRPQNRPISSLWKLLYVPAVIVTLGILTNDLHQLAFRFPDSLENWNGVDYTYGPLYFLAVLWIVALFAAILVIVFVRCAVPENRRKIWMPMIPLIFAVVYCVSYLTSQDNLLVETFRMPEFFCFIFAAFMECVISVHLIPSNDSYGDLWNSSSIGAGIMDNNGVIRYKSKVSIRVTEEQVRNAVNNVVLLNDGRFLLKSHAINGGFGYWTKDISEINRLNRELADLGDVLIEENAMLDAENRLAEERIQVEQQNKLYDYIAGSVSPQIDKLSQLIDAPSENDKSIEQKMKYACILYSYIKRLSNMLLLFYQNKHISSGELCLAITESLEYVNLCQIKTYFDYIGESELNGGYVLLAYEVFESVIESGIPKTDAVLVNLEISDKFLNLRIEMNSPEKTLPEGFMIDKISVLGGTLETETEQTTEYVSLYLPTGGESV